MKKSTLMKCGIAMLISPIVFSSCATMFAKKTAPIVLMNYKSGVKVSENGSNLRLESVMAHGTAGYNSTTEYYAQGVMLDKKKKHHKLTIESNGKSGTVDVKLGAGINWIILDTFTGGVLGWAIDAATGKWRVARNKYIDVDAVVNNTKPMSQRKLKRIMKREAK